MSVVNKEISFWAALVPILVLTVLLTCNVFMFDNVLGGSNQLAMLLAAGVGVVIAIAHGHKWDKIQARVYSTIQSAMPSMVLLLIIGCLAGSWLISGVVPAMIYYGLAVISAKAFLVTAVIVSAIISVVTGSSWSTVATIGVALIGIGNALGFNPAMTAGAIISGAYFGDKMSPLSDTTNLAPAMAGVDIFSHIRYMCYTTVPSILITMIIFLVLGLNHVSDAALTQVDAVQAAILGAFNITPWLLLLPIFLLLIIAKKIPAIPALFIGSIIGCIFALIFQRDLLVELGDVDALGTVGSYYKVLIQSMFGDTDIHTAIPAVNDLLSSSGMKGMVPTFWLIFMAMIFGGVMEGSGMLESILRPILARVKDDSSLVMATVLTCIGFNLTTSDQYIAIVVPGRMFRPVYRRRGLAPEVLSRTLEDSATVTSAMIPWNTCGATQSRVLGVATLAYLPFCFFNLISPIMTILFALFNLKIHRLTAEEAATEED